ncbi:site-specific integrase [Ensifer aridi]|uniref:site-specific integrase n=1 Tax=Ensifer aridi TaxID=1708715 RepID=UPI000A0F6743|nr:site-specific integrase [Ensifer aridi]
MIDTSVPWETRLVLSDDAFEVDDKPVGKLPLAINRDEGLVICIQSFLLEGAVRTADPWRTSEKYGYILCQWYDYLRLNGIGVFDADESDLRNFLLGGGKRDGNVRAIRRTNELTLDSTNVTKLNVIVAFYDFWERVRGVKLRSFRGATLATLNQELFTRANRSISKAKINYSRAGANKTKKQVGTPTPEEAEMVLERVLDQPDDNRAQTWYLIGSIARRSGSRACGISSLTVAKLLQGLANERLFRQLSDYRNVLKGHLVAENRRLIVRTLQRMQAERRTFIYCDVRNKGGDWVPIAVPIELCTELIDYICTCRQDVIRTRFLPKSVTPPDNVFLSYKPRVSGGALTPEAMSNFYNSLFKELEIDGTLHRLRATFCEEVIRDIYIRERAVNGRAWQVNNVLEFARKLLGHKNPHSLEHYLNNIMAQELMLGNPVMVYSVEDVPYVRAACEALAGPAQESFRAEFKDFLNERGVQPIVEEDRRYALF